MQCVGTSKVTKLSAKAGIIYPLVRLPKSYAEKIGKTARMFELQNEKEQALLVTFGDCKRPNTKAVQSVEIIQSDQEVIQPKSLDEAKSRLFKLESDINELKALLFLKQYPTFHLKPKIKGRGRDSNPRRGLHRAIG
jgi:hypothetical protein